MTSTKTKEIRDAEFALAERRALVDSYQQLQREAEDALLDIMKRYESVHLLAHTDTTLWLAAHRLVERGVIKRGAISNSFLLPAEVSE